MDNASNCGTMMEDLERLLTLKGIPFHRDGNRIRYASYLVVTVSHLADDAFVRCFPHVINIAVKHGLSALTDLEDTDADLPQGTSTTAVAEDLTDAAESIPGVYLYLPPVDRTTDALLNTALQSEDNELYATALEDDPIKAARQLVATCRASSQRRDAFTDAIIEGNRTGAFGEGVVIPILQLLRDVDTRWSSTFLMIDRLLVLYPVRFLHLTLRHIVNSSAMTIGRGVFHEPAQAGGDPPSTPLEDAARSPCRHTRFSLGSAQCSGALVR